MEANRKPGARGGLIAGLLVAALVVVWGGYSHHWPWTGINGHTATLWDWLHLLLLPVALGLVPILLSRELRMRPEHKLLGLSAIFALTLLVVAGYAIPWSWTGFEGNRLWDWLELLALPLAVAVLPVIPSLRAGWSRRYSLAAAAVLLALAGIVIGGYVGRWSWTGFQGNTLWDWLHLLLLPLLLPTVIVPAVMSVASAQMVVADEAESNLRDLPSVGVTDHPDRVDQQR